MYKPRIEVVFGNERIISPSGLNIVGAMLGKSDFKKRCDRRKRYFAGKSGKQYPIQSVSYILF